MGKLSVSLVDKLQIIKRYNSGKVTFITFGFCLTSLLSCQSSNFLHRIKDQRHQAMGKLLGWQHHTCCPPLWQSEPKTPSEHLE